MQFESMYFSLFLRLKGYTDPHLLLHTWLYNWNNLLLIVFLVFVVVQQVRGLEGHLYFGIVEFCNLQRNIQDIKHAQIIYSME